MPGTKFAAAAMMVAGALARPDEEARATVAEWDTYVTDLGYDYDMYTVTTSDNWELSMFRILPKTGTTMLTDQVPILLQHSSMMDSLSWLQAQPDDLDPMPMQLVDRGLDVWMANSRGTKYSNTNADYPKADDDHFSYEMMKQNVLKYNYSWAEQGEIDTPAFIDKILEVTAQEKVSYVGYGEATTSLLYGLTQIEESYYADKLERAVLLAPCLFVSSLGLQNYLDTYPVMRDDGVNAVNGVQWSNQLESICADHDAACATASTYSGEQMTVKSLEYYEQIAISDAFQTYIPHGQGFPQNQTSALVTPGLESIDQVPLYIFAGDSDTVCPLEQVTRIVEEIGGTVVHKNATLTGADHSYFLWTNEETWTNQLSETITACMGPDCVTETDDEKMWGWLYIAGGLLAVIIVICCLVSCCKKDKDKSH